ncbi:MAG: hypothetical protein MJE77_02165 [Proteobacteria bacterium]|nr:hypothetical protein [Pseudomonadota bacterium]
MAKHRTVFIALLRSWFSGLRYIRGHPEEAKQVIVTATEQTPEEINLDGIVIFSFEDNYRVFTDRTDKRSLIAGAELNVEFMLERGDLNRRPAIPLILDSSIADALKTKK